MSDGLELDGDGHLGTSNVPVKRGPIALKLKSSSAADSPSQSEYVTWDQFAVVPN